MLSNTAPDGDEIPLPLCGIGMTSASDYQGSGAGRQKVLLLTSDDY